MDPDIAERTLREMEELHARVARLEGMWDKIKDAAKSVKDKAAHAYHAATAKDPHTSAVALLEWAHKNHVSGTSGKLEGNAVEMDIHGKHVRVTANADGSFLVEKEGNEAATVASMELLQKQLKIWAESKAMASVADIHAYSAAIRLQQQMQQQQNLQVSGFKKIY
jgi:hypothetical protein